jgi:hypothetical protein
VSPVAATIIAAAPPPLSPLILLSLLALLATSVTMYWLLVRRWTSRRQWVSLAEWARQSGFRLGRRAGAGDAILPPPLDALGSARIAVRLELTGDRSSILQAQPADPPDAPPGAHPTPLNLLVRKLEAAWPPTALRPVHSAAGKSVADLYSLAGFPLMGAGQRFGVLGADEGAARTLAQSSVRALLPQDVGLLLHGQYLVLDFSTRPFDGLEFSRMISLADQLVAHLPGVRGTG